MISTKHVLTATAALLAVACQPDAEPLAPTADPDFGLSAPTLAGPGAVYLTSNEAAGNTILVFDRAADGTLTAAPSVPTGGLGTGGGLGNQHSMVLTQDHRRLYVVNAGSDDISAFRVSADALEAIGTPVSSGGDQPISLAVHRDLLYVLNAGNGGNIAGFRIGPDGSITPIAGSTRPLGGAGPAQIEFTPDGRVLVVTEKSTNTITTYVVGPDGLAGAPATQASAGDTPFGFGFNERGDLVVSEAAGGSAGLSSASSYRIADDGTLSVVSAAVATTQTAACWIAISQNGRHAYTTNTGSGTLSSLAIDSGAELSLADAVAGVTGAGSLPQDAAFTPGGRFLYVRNAGGSVGAFQVNQDGALTAVADFGPIATFANGIVAR